MNLRAQSFEVVLALMILTSPFGMAATVSSTQPTQISPKRVTFALAAAHLPVQSSQVELLAETASKSATSLLKVTRVEKWNEASALIRIRCAKSSECMPFYVVVRWPNSRQRDLALAPPIPGGRPVFVAVRKEPLVRAGDQAVMITNTDKFHAATPIICLQTGAQGQRVRVATLNRKKIAMAEVIDTGVLTGSFSAE